MNFLVVVFGLVLLYWPRFFSVIQNDRWFVWWQTKIGAVKLFQSMPIVTLIITLGVPVSAIWWLLASLKGAVFGLPYLLLNIGLLLYAFGRGDSREQVDELVNDLNRGDMQAAFHDLAVFSVDSKQGDALDRTAFLEELKARLAYSYFERHLAVLFYFMLAGAPLACLYRLSVLYRQNVRALGEAENTVLQKPGQAWLWLLEWLPLRIVGLSLALVGHFNAAWQAWLEVFFGRETSQRNLLRLVNAALEGTVDQVQVQVQAEPALKDPEPFSAGASQLVRRVEELFFKAIVVWLVIIALLIILA